MLRAALLLFLAHPVLAESGYAAWLRYAALDEPAARVYRDALRYRDIR